MHKGVFKGENLATNPTILILGESHYQSSGYDPEFTTDGVVLDYFQNPNCQRYKFFDKIVTCFGFAPEDGSATTSHPPTAVLAPPGHGNWWQKTEGNTTGNCLISSTPMELTRFSASAEWCITTCRAEPPLSPKASGLPRKNSTEKQTISASLSICPVNALTRM